MMMLFEDAVRERRSPRDFLSTPLTNEQLRLVLQDAQLAPSNCNTQPWHVHIVSGQKKEEVTASMIKAAESDPVPDFSFDPADYRGVYGDRRKEQGRTYYEALGIAREDKEARAKTFKRNLEFFGAPHAAFLFMPAVGDNVRVASDIGMYAQNFLLSLTARGMAGIPQTLLGFYSNTVREALGVSDEYKLLFGISFGFEDPHGISRQVRMGRADINDSVVFHN